MDFLKALIIGIWSVPGCPFVALEQWCGIADTKLTLDGVLEHKPGIISLEPGQSIAKH